MKLTTETKQAILSAYNDKSRRAHDIADEFGVSTQKLTQIVIEMGGQPRRPKSMGKRDGKKGVKRCPHCHTKININGAKYCFNCGSDIREQKDLLIERNRNLLQNLFKYIPETHHTEFENTILETITYLNK